MDEATRKAAMCSVTEDIARLTAEISELERLRAYLARPRGEIAPVVPAEVLPPAGWSCVTINGRSVIREASDRDTTWRELIEQVLRDQGPNGPMSAVKIAEMLVKNYGAPASTGRALERKVYTIMFRRLDRFVNLGGGRWTLAEYHPERARHQELAAKASRSLVAGADEGDEDDSDTEEVKR